MLRTMQIYFSCGYFNETYVAQGGDFHHAIDGGMTAIEKVGKADAPAPLGVRVGQPRRERQIFDLLLKSSFLFY